MNVHSFPSGTEPRVELLMYRLDACVTLFQPAKHCFQSGYFDLQYQGVEIHWLHILSIIWFSQSPIVSDLLGLQGSLPHISLMRADSYSSHVPSVSSYYFLL